MGENVVGVGSVGGVDKMVKKVYLIHGWGGSDSREGWFGWLKKEFKNKGIKVIGLNMPDTDYPTIEKWVGFLEKNVEDINEETYFIGHSVGCQAIMRFLEKLPENTKVAGGIFVAPWMELDKNTIEEEGEEVKKIAKPWMETPINWDKVKSHTSRFICILSDNDPYVPLSNEEFFKEKLNAETIIKNNEEHFNATKEIKEIVEFIEK